MSRAAVDALLWLLDQAFADDVEHALLANLRTVPPAAWTWLPDGGQRSIRALVQHVGGCTVMYDNHAFGDAALAWDDPIVQGDGALADVATAVAWLRQGHTRLREHIAALDDGELARPRRTHWGDRIATRTIVGVLIQHDLYHAGEINHLRALYEGNDQWGADA
jgi:hypothetical protein